MNVSDLNLVGYMMLTCLSIFWSATALNRRTVIPAILSFICWVATAIVHISLFNATALYPISYLYFGFALIFFVLTLDSTLKLAKWRG